MPQRPTPEARASFRKQFARTRKLDDDESDLLWTIASDALSHRDCGKALRLLERPAVDFMDSLACFANFVRAVSALLESAGRLGLSERATDQLKRKWEESSHAFYAVHHDMAIDNERFVSKLASLCNRWSQAQPRRVPAAWRWRGSSRASACVTGPVFSATGSQTPTRCSDGT